MPDQDAADLKFRSGEVDGVDNVKPENYRWYEDHQQEGNYTLHDLGPALNTNFFWFNLNQVRKATPGKKVGDPHVDPVKYAWFNNPVFRRAVSMAIDRDAMIPSIFFGDAVKNWSQPHAGQQGLVHAGRREVRLQPRPRRRSCSHRFGWKDKNGDGFVEDASGHTVGFTLKTNSDNKMRVAMANFIRDDLAKVGIKVTLVPVDFNTLITNLREDFQYEAILLGLQSGVPPDPGMGQNVWRSSGRTHYWNMAQPKPETPEEARIDALMDVLVGTPDLDEAQGGLEGDRRTSSTTSAGSSGCRRSTSSCRCATGSATLQPSVIPHRLHLEHRPRLREAVERDSPDRRAACAPTSHGGFCKSSRCSSGSRRSRSCCCSSRPATS